MVSCYLVLALASTRLVVCCLLTGSGTRSLRPPWSGVSAIFGAPHPITCVLRRWPGPGPGVQATEQSRISRCGKLASRLELVRPDRHGSPRRPRRSNLTILSESFGQIKFWQIKFGQMQGNSVPLARYPVYRWGG
jgi:hypothetical protein